jgi:cytochrome c oxidase subunit 3
MSEAAGLSLAEHRDYTGAKIGMWLFLFTEILLFGGLFLIYAVYRSVHPQEFHVAAAELNVLLGSANTLVLLTSSLSMVLSVHAMQKGNRRLTLLFLWATIALGAVFLVNKYFEWDAKIHHGVFPGSPKLLERSDGEVLFYGLYYVMTGLHGVHVLAGVVILGFVFAFIVRRPQVELLLGRHGLKRLIGGKLVLLDGRGKVQWESGPVDETAHRLRASIHREPTNSDLSDGDFIKLENAGLYWHLVDIIWIFLFPLFYLIT